MVEKNGEEGQSFSSQAKLMGAKEVTKVTRERWRRILAGSSGKTEADEENVRRCIEWGSNDPVPGATMPRGRRAVGEGRS